jgi:hypothetical protein
MQTNLKVFNLLLPINIFSGAPLKHLVFDAYLLILLNLSLVLIFPLEKKKYQLIVWPVLFATIITNLFKPIYYNRFSCLAKNIFQKSKSRQINEVKT